MKTVITTTGMTQNRFLPALYHLIIDNEPQVMVTARVDDFLWGETGKGAEVMKISAKSLYLKQKQLETADIVGPRSPKHVKRSP